MAGNAPLDDFTESAYRRLVEATKERFAFVSLEELLPATTSVAVWRHDVDISPQRALAIARIDFEVGVQSHFYFQLGSEFYSPLEPYFRAILREIDNLGHSIGLHFDASYTNTGELGTQISHLNWEKDILATILGHEIKTFSIHNPTVSESQLMNFRSINGLTNASWQGWLDLATYCSDSNGYWRFESAHGLIDSQDITNLYLLTHPEWWQVSKHTPFESVDRAVSGRRFSVLENYRNLLREHGRQLIGDSR